MNKILTLFLFISLGQISLNAQLTGIRYIGATGDYPTVTAAVAALNTQGISGNVIFKIQSGTYIEQFTINKFSRANPTDSVIFQSEKSNPDSVTIAFTGYPGHSYVVKLNNTEGITFRNLTFKNDAQNNCLITRFVGNNKKIRFEYNQFIVPEVTAMNDSLHIFYSVMQKDTAIIIKDNYFEGGDYAIYLSGYITNSSKGLQIINNTFRKQYKGSIYVDTYASSVFIAKNDIHIGWNNQASNGIYLMDIDDSVAVENNNVAVAQGMGIYLNTCHSTVTTDLTIVNNRISTLNADACLSFQNCKQGKIISNTFYTHHADQTHYAISLGNFGNTAVENNLFVNDNGGAFILESVPYGGNTINYNVFSGSFQLGRSSSVLYSTLSLWQGTGYDAQSKTATFPTFINDDFNDLKLSCNNSPSLQITKTFNATVYYDCEGEIRPSAAGVSIWAGADEFYPGNKQSYIKGTVISGPDTLQAGKVYLYANTTAQHKWNIIDSMDIQFDGSFASKAVPLMKYILQAVPDENDYPNLIPTYQSGYFNWDSTQTFLSDTCNVIYKNIDLIPLLATSVGNAKISGYVYNDGSFKTNDPIPGLDIILDKIPPSKSVQKTKTDSYGYYEFNNLDTGHYQINVDVTGILLDSLYSVDITNADSVYTKFDYCIDSLVGVCFGHSAVSFVQKKNSDIKVWPNPIQNQLNIQFPSGKESYRIDIVDIVGKQVYSKVSTGEVKLMELDLTVIPEGIYIVKISSENSVSEMKIIKQ